jgi:hypothetical protein
VGQGITHRARSCPPPSAAPTQPHATVGCASRICRRSPETAMEAWRSAIKA